MIKNQGTGLDAYFSLKWSLFPHQKSLFVRFRVKSRQLAWQNFFEGDCGRISDSETIDGLKSEAMPGFGQYECDRILDSETMPGFNITNADEILESKIVAGFEQ